MNTYLDKIIEQTISTVELDKQMIPLQKLRSYLSDLNETKGFYESIKARHDDGLISVIAEIKQASPSQGLIRENFKPKDIVSGDFYWFEQQGDKLWFAVADCTGHGVPGAFMSMLGINALDQAIQDKSIQSPGAMLDRLNKHVQQTVHDASNELQISDGMDMTLCCLNLKSNSLQVAGAMNAAYLVRDGKLQVLTADRQPVGHYVESVRVPFTTQEIELQSGDMLYLFSDGYYDQFGGPKGRKFKIGAFKKLLTKASEQPVSRQKTLLNDTIIKWMGDKEEQIDDICIMGIRI